MLGVAALLFCAAGASLAQITVLEVIPLRYRMAQELIPIIQPMLAREGSVSGFQGQLVVRTTPANLEEIKRILASLDTAPRQLIISVRQEADVDRSRSSAEISGSVGGDHGRVTIPGGGDTRGGNVVLRDGDDRLRVNVQEGGASERDRSDQTVRVPVAGQRARGRRQRAGPQRPDSARPGRARSLRARRAVRAGARAAGAAVRGRRAGSGAGGGRHPVPRRGERLLRPAAPRRRPRHARRELAARVAGAALYRQRQRAERGHYPLRALGGMDAGAWGNGWSSAASGRMPAASSRSSLGAARARRETTAGC